MSEERPTTRRTVLRSLTAGLAVTGLTAGTAAGDDDGPSDGDTRVDPGPFDVDVVTVAKETETTDADRIVEPGGLPATASDCYTDADCRSGCSGRGQVYERQCCRSGGGYICEDWQATPFCCS